MFRDRAPLPEPDWASLRRALECAVCLSPMRFPATLVPCGHALDARCAADLWQRAPLQRFLCPVCRRPCELLMPAYALRAQCDMMRAHHRAVKTAQRAAAPAASAGDNDDDEDDEDEAERNEPAELRRVESSMRAYNATFASGSDEGFVRSLWSGLTLGVDALRNVALLPGWHQVLVVAFLTVLVAYVVFPFDLVPELQFGMLGMIDDFLLAVLLFTALGLTLRSVWQRR